MENITSPELHQPLTIDAAASPATAMQPQNIAYEYQLCSRAEVERMKGAIQAAMEGVFFEYLDIVWEIGEAQQLRSYTRTAPYLDFTDTHAQLPTAEAAIQAATTLWQKWAHTFEAYKQVQQGLPDMFMGKLIPQNAQAHSKTDSNGRVMAPQRGIYRSWKVTYCVQLELMPQVFAVPENFVFTVEVVAIGKQFRLIGLEGTLPLMRSKTAAPVVLAAVPAGKFLWQLAAESSKLFPFVQTYQEAVQDGKPVLLASDAVAMTEAGRNKINKKHLINSIKNTFTDYIYFGVYERVFVDSTGKYESGHTIYSYDEAIGNSLSTIKIVESHKEHIYRLLKAFNYAFVNNTNEVVLKIKEWLSISNFKILFSTDMHAIEIGKQGKTVAGEYSSVEITDRACLG